MMKALLEIFYKKDRAVVALVFAVGLVLTVGLLLETAREIDRHEKNLFADEKNHIRDSVMDQLRAASESLHNMAALFTVSAGEVDSDGFRLIAEAALAQQRAVRFLSFARWVPKERKEAFEERNWRASGVAQFRIHSHSEDQNEADFFLPIVYLEPLTPKSISYLGQDIWSQPAFREYIQKAVDSGNTVASDDVFDQSLQGFTLVKAVYTGGISPLSVEQRQRSVLGILRVFLSSDELLKSLNRFENFTIELTAKDSKIVAKKPKLPSANYLLFQKRMEEVAINIAGVQYRLKIEKDVPFTVVRAGIYLMVFLLGTTLSILIANRCSSFIRSQREMFERQAEIERKVEEKTKALQQSEILLRQVINSIPNVIFAQTQDQRIVFANRTFFDLFEVSEAEVYQKQVHLHLPGQKLERGSWEEEVHFGNGQTLWFETHRVDIELEQQGTCSLIVAVDITQRKRDNAVIADQRAKMVASAKLSALGEMAGGIAHEINTPLTTLQLCSDFIVEALKMRVPDLESVQEQNMMIAKTTERIGKIVIGLRAFSKDGSSDQMARFSLAQTIENTLALCREKFRHSAIRLEWNPTKDVEVIGREVQISQVILNLLNNSFDAVQEVRNPWIRIHLNEAQGSAEILVEDNGYGVSREAQERLFHPFFTTKESGKGTGLGLSISRGIIETHEGKLFLDASVSHTRFVILLPVARPSLQPVPPFREHRGLQ